MNRLALLLLLAYSAPAQTKVDPARVDRLLQRAVVIDLHDDTTQMIVDEAYNLGEKHDYGQVDIPRMRAGHVWRPVSLHLDRFRPLHAHRGDPPHADADRRRTPRNRPASRRSGNGHHRRRDSGRPETRAHRHADGRGRRACHR